MQTGLCYNANGVQSIWYHAVVLDIFRPFIADEKQHDFKKWTSLAKPPEAIFAASVKQLKRLILVYDAQHESSTYSVFWHAGLMYVANAVIKDLGGDDWKFSFFFAFVVIQNCLRRFNLPVALHKVYLEWH
jgi:hypothetical protein